MSELIERYNVLSTKVDELKLKEAAAEARFEDASKVLAATVEEVKGLGFQSAADLEKAIVDAESELKTRLDEASTILSEAGLL